MEVATSPVAVSQPTLPSSREVRRRRDSSPAAEHVPTAEVNGLIFTWERSWEHGRNLRVSTRSLSDSLDMTDCSESFEMSNHSESNDSMVPAFTHQSPAGSVREPSLHNFSEASPTETSISSGLVSRFSGVPLLDDVNGVLETPAEAPRRPVYECTFWFLYCSYVTQDEDDWNVHCLSHFRGEEPPTSVQCPLCDFSNTSVTGWLAWEFHMKHISETHVMIGQTLKISRPDFSLYRHLWQKQLIDDQDLRELRGGNHCLTRPPLSYTIATKRRSSRQRRRRGTASRPSADRMIVHPDYWTPRHTPSNSGSEDNDGLSQVQLERIVSLESDPDVPNPAPDGSTMAPTDTHFDSGYHSVTDTGAKATSEIDDTMSIRSILTNASRVDLPAHEREQLTSAFAVDLCQDMKLSRYSDDARERILSRLPDLLKGFTLRLEESTTCKAERNAKEFLRQQRNRITHQLRKSQSPEEPAEDDSQTLTSKGGMSVMEKMALWKIDVESDPSSERATNNQLYEFERPPRYEEVRSYLLEGLAYEWLIKRVQTAGLLTDRKGTTVETIAETMNTILASTVTPKSRENHVIQVHFSLDWDLLYFLKEQEYGVSPEIAIERAITITGAHDDAQALSCVDYMWQTWESIGQEMIEVLKNTLMSPIHTYSTCLTDGTTIEVTLESSRTKIMACGGQATLVELCEQFAWLGAALRSGPSVGQHSVTPRVKAMKNDISVSNTPSITVEIVFEVVPIPKEVSASLEGTCWHAMFSAPMVVTGFPIRSRDMDERGLEISLDMIITLAETQFATHYDAMLLLKGFHTMLVPTMYRIDSITWHFLFTTERRIPYHHFRKYCRDCVSTRSFNVDTLESQTIRHFVGWASETSKHLGTEDISYEKIRWAGAKKCSAGLAVEQKLTISASKIVGVSGSVLRGNRDKPDYIKHSAYTMQIEAARNMPVVLYDTGSQRGWLVDGASALLHLVRTQVATKPYGGSDSLFNDSNVNIVPFRHPKSDGGPDAAAEILRDENNMKHIILREFDSYTEETVTLTKSSEARKEKYKTTCLRELISQTWSVIEQIYDRQVDAATTHTVKQLRLPFRVALEGYEFMDIVSAKHILRRRAIGFESNGSAWIDFTTKTQAITLFGQNFGDIYKPAPGIQRQICKDWTLVPPGHEFLTIPVSLLRDIKQRLWEDGEVDASSSELAQGLFWMPSEPCFSICGPGCKHILPGRVQRFLASISNKTVMSGDGSWSDRMFTHKQGVVIFGSSSNLDPRKLEHFSRLIVPVEDSFHDSGLGSSVQSASRDSSHEEQASGRDRESELVRDNTSHVDINCQDTEDTGAGAQSPAEADDVTQRQSQPTLGNQTSKAPPKEMRKPESSLLRKLAKKVFSRSPKRAM
ncbi:hypothetical protein BU24DRAFT_491882 [Aaosphaeria arxii CBS 175.79]|uniref:Uncharacterized protein n=1 Tax=Aaosphaeria arxii CBS 175.79 TaxID=1450172 RepID=A0A6A5XQV1_9PLEO|nr:uncharacterized protein BU24DRAFT_491882 [Aaosphaeria arxii CBS 175.79]KAF2015665.1 hypothetical protein BU24DRAFT_491882 [Aaosphaeria arxii CBS 175.79]